MKYILVIDGVESTRYIYNVWSVVPFVLSDGIESYQQDARIFMTDDFDELSEFLKTL